MKWRQDGTWGQSKCGSNHDRGGAKVNVEVAQATLGQPFLVRVIAELKNLELSEVYLQVRSVERAEVRDVDYDYGDHRQRIEYVQGSHIAFNQRFGISGKQTLNGERLKLQRRSRFLRAKTRVLMVTSFVPVGNHGRTRYIW